MALDFDNVMRWYDDEPDDWPEATVKLIDALRGYIRSNEEMDEAAEREGWEKPSLDFARKHRMHMQTATQFLKELETFEVCCDKCWIQWKRYYD